MVELRDLSPSSDPNDVRDAVATNRLWYHTIELRPGITTPGWFDLRGVVDRFPWPDVRGKRCLDIGTYDGFLAFELERRGAASVVATDIGSHENWDWPPALRARGAEALAEIAGEKGSGFEIASKALGSRVEKEVVSIYDLSPERVGVFDVVVCGSLLLHLRDPFRALEAIRSVTSGYFLSSEQIDASMTLLHRRTPMTTMPGGTLVQWHVPNLAGHRHMIRHAGFVIERAPRPFGIAYGPAHPELPRRLWIDVSRKLVGGNKRTVPHSAILARPA